MLNQCTFIGRLGADPEIRSMQTGYKTTRMVSLRLAVSEQWKDKETGEKKEKTEWIPITIWNDGLIAVAERYLRKGSKILVTGKWQTRKWQDQNGVDRYSTDCVLQGFDSKLIMLDTAGQDGSKSEQSSQGERKQSSRQKVDFDDEIPF